MIRNAKRGFTLIEILVVISIIGVLSSIAYVSYGEAKEKGIMASRIASAGEIRKALEMYHSDNGAYPDTGGQWMSDSCTMYHQEDWIPGLVEGKYMSALPRDPEHQGDDTVQNNMCCYMYKSDGTDYKLMFAYRCDNARADDTGPVPQSIYAAYADLIDPNRDGGGDSCVTETDGPIYALAYYTPVACKW